MKSLCLTLTGILAVGLFVCQCNLGYDVDSVELRDAAATDPAVEPQPDTQDIQTDDLQLDPVVEPDVAPDQVIDPIQEIRDEDVATVCDFVDLGSALGRVVASGDTTTAGNDSAGSCGGDMAQDVVFKWTAPADSLYHFDTFGSRFPNVIYVREETCDGPELDCYASASTLFHLGLDLALDAQDVVFVFIDGMPQQAGRFTLTILDMNDAESDCTNELDEDYDGSPDCRDPGCQPTADCEPGTGAAGSACTDNIMCSATERDPACLQEAFGQTWLDGYCSEFCSETDVCPEGSVCQTPEGVSWGICLATCDPETDPTGCRPGYICQPLEGVTGVCVPSSL